MKVVGEDGYAQQQRHDPTEEEGGHEAVAPVEPVGDDASQGAEADLADALQSRHDADPQG